MEKKFTVEINDMTRFDSFTGERKVDKNVWIRCDGQGVALVTYKHGYMQDVSKETLEIANTLSAAPELYKALEWAMNRIDKLARHSAHEGDAELYKFAEAQAALAQARGEG